MTNTVNRMKLALVLALVAGLLAATIGLFGSGWPPSVSAQTDTAAPTVSSVAITSDAGNGVYGIGDDIEATVTFSEDVTVTDTPRLGLDIGGTSKTASYESTSGSTVVFSYTVAEGDSDHDGIAIRANRLILSGGTIRDAADNDADLSHDALSAQEDHEVDGIRPSVSRIYIPASTHTTDRAFTIGDPIWIYTDWSERLYVTGNPQLTLDFDGTSKTSTYTDGWLGHFSEYTVVEGDSAPDGVAIPANAISLNGGSIRDRAGNDAVLTHSAVSADSLSWTFIPVDGIRPTITSIEIISDPGDDDTYTAGDEIRILVTFSENIQPVDRSGEGRIFQTTIELNIGGKARTAEHFGHLDAVIALTYTVQAGDTDANGISIDANKMWNGPVLHPDGYTLLDRPSASNWAAGNPADVSHDAVADDSGHKVAAAPQPNNPATGAPTISGTVQVGETLWTNTAGIADNDGLDNADFAYQWITNDGTIDTDIAGATGATYTLVSEDAGKTIRVQVSFTDDTGNKERLTSTPTAAVSAAPPPPPDNVRAVTQKSGAVELTWEAPDGATVAGYRIERRRADEDRRGNHTLVEDTGSSETGYTDESAEKGVEYEYRVSARNEDGAGEASGWVSAATVPTISSVAITSDPDDDDLSEYYDDSVYAIGDSIKVTATFSENVTVTGAPKLEVNIGGKAKTATYDSSKDNEVVFSYTVAEGDSDTDGIAVGANKLSLNAGTIKDGADNSAVLTHSALSVQSGHKVDGIRPTVTSVYFVPTSFGNDGIHTIGERLWVQVVLSEDFRVYIGPRIILNLEGTSTSVGFSPLSRGSNLVFFYIVKKGDLDLDGVSVSANSLTARGLTDAAGNDAVLTHTGVSEDPDYIVDGVPPTVSSIAITSDPGDDDTYSIGNKIEITVTLSEDVGVFFGPWDGPQVALNIGGSPKSASFVSENAGVMLFSYTVKYGDNDADGVSIDANSLSGGIVQDTNGDSFSSGNDADLRHTSVDDDADHKVTTTTPAKSADATLSGLTLTDVNFGTFASGTTSYSADVANSVTQTTVTPTVNHSDASYIIKLGGVTDADETVALAVGSNVITVEVTAEDGNTTRTYTVTVTRAATSISAPDLTVPSVITSSSPFGYNPSFNLGVNVTNRGNGSSGSTTLHYYRSADSTITSGDTEVGTDAVDGLAASEISNESIDLAAPSAPGTYYYGACVDAVADESDTTNNCSPGIAWVVPDVTSTDATLSGLSLTDVNFGTFASGTTSYTADVANSVTQTTITPTLNDSNASYVIKLGGVTDDETVALAVGSNVITVEVTAEDDITTRTYTVTVTRAAPSTDATLRYVLLSGIDIGAGLGEGAYAQTQSSFTASVYHSVSQTTVTPTPNHSAASPVIKLGGVTDADGVISLAAGSNVITVEVTAEDGQTTKAYTVTVNRATSSAPTTGELSTDDPPVNFRTSSYTHESVSLAFSTPRNRGITGYVIQRYEHDGDDFVSAGADGRYERLRDYDLGGYSTYLPYNEPEPDTLYKWVVKLVNSENTTVIETSLTVRTPPEPGTTTLSSDATLSDLTLSDIDFQATDNPFFSEGFHDTVTSYSASVANSVTETTVTPTVNHSGATHVIKLGGVTDADETVSLAVGSNVITIEVTAEDGETTRTYTVTVTRISSDAATDATLRRLVLSDVDFGTFAPDTTSYTAQVANSVTETTVSPYVSHRGASYVAKLGGVTDTERRVALAVGSNVITIEVTAEDLVTTKTYTVTVRRSAPPSTDATLSALTLSDVNFGTFASGTTSYTADVANGVSQTTVTPTVNHSEATPVIKLGGVTDSDGAISLAVGSNVITVVVTAEDDITTRTYTVTVTRAAISISAPDLTVPSVFTSSSPFGYSSSFTLVVNVTNRGNGSSGSTTLHYYRSADSTITSGDTEVGTDAVDGLAASEISNEDIDLTAPDTPGTYYYGACVDAVADESDTTNNCSPGIAWVVPAAPSSTDATGAPAISGTVQVGETLTADTSGITDDDGLENVSFSYQWLTDDTAIQGATNSTYTLIEADEGKTVRVRVSFTDDGGNDETLTSAATATVEAAPNSPATGAPTISGTAQVGETLTADTSGISDADGLSSVSYSYQWIRNDGSSDSAISGATGSAYTLDDADEGNTVKVRVSFTDDAGNEESLTSAATDTVSAAPTSNTLATGAPTIGGTIQVGETLTADTSGIADADGLDDAAYSYQWLAGDSDISGATSSAYTLADADEGKTVKVRVSFTDDAGNEESLTSAATEAVAGNEEPVAGEDAAAWSATMTVEWVYQGYGYYSTDAKKAGSLSPASFEVDGTTYTVKMVETQGWWMYIGVDRELPFGFVLELDGVRFASNDASFRSYSYGNIYRWEGTGLSLSDGDTVEVRLLRAFEDETAVNSAATGAPTISGTVQVGETLTVDTSGISDADGLTNATLSYQWLADDADISGATGSTYTLTDSDEVKAIKVQVSFTDDAGNDETLTSAATDPVEAALAANSPATGAPTISGAAQVGETLTVDTTGIADTDGLDNPTFTYQWLGGDAAIAGATGSTYTLTDADEGKAIKVQVSFTDDAGNDETLTSAATDAVATAEPSGPPAKPTGLSATPSHDRVVLTWDDPQDDSITGYVILRRDNDIHEEGTFETVESDTGSAETAYIDASIEPVKRYVYRIKAINADGLSEISSWVRADTPAAPTPEPPAKPTGLSATPSHDQVVLTWNDPNDDTITGYVILRRNRDTDAEGQFTELVADTGSAATGYTDDTVVAETPYTYRIKAINEHGTSERSRWVHLETTAAPTPEGTPEQSVSEGDTDLPNDNSTPGRVAVGGSATGTIGTAGDQDRFAVELVAGRTYQFDLTGSPGGGGTLPDTFFRAIYNSEGQYQADSYNDDFDGGRDSRVTFTPTESGTYYARVSGDRDETGSYTLSVTDVTPQ